MVEFRQSSCILAEVVDSGESDCIRAKEVYFRVKIVVFWQSSCLLTEVVVFMRRWLYSDKVVVFGKKWL